MEETVASLGQIAGEEMAPTSSQAVTLARSGESFASRFKRLAQEWKGERNPYSSRPDELAMCWPYQQIIAMGPPVIPLILEEMRTNPDHWFWALSALTDIDPVPPSKRGQFSAMTQAWLEWGEQNIGTVHS